MLNQKRIMKHLFIFDIDGTLTDSVLVYHQAFHEALTEFGIKSYNPNFNDYLHHTDSYIFRIIFEDFFKTRMNSEDLLRFEITINQALIHLTEKKTIKEIKGANDFLTKIQMHPNIDIAFATGSLLLSTQTKLKQARINFNSELIITSNQQETREELVNKAIEKASHWNQVNKYDSILSFGDGKWDYETAKKLNLRFIGIGNDTLLNLGNLEFHSDFESIDLNNFNLKKAFN
jgi:beta-phosphoglucomutase-like phosphatase (HAD superfamily)